MTNVIVKELRIVLKTGRQIYHYPIELLNYDKIDDVLFPGFITALTQFAITSSNKELRSIRMQDDQYFFTIKDPIIIVLILDQSEEEAHHLVIDTILKYLCEIFLRKYKNFLNAGDNIFSRMKITYDLTEEVEHYLQDPIY